MWLFSKYGFYSVVCARQEPGHLDSQIDLDRVMVRARKRDHLGNLINRFSKELGDCEVFAYSHTDYPYRIFVAKSIWADVLSQLAQEMDYGNFKSAAASHLGRAEADYLHALHDVWAVMDAM